MFDILIEPDLHIENGDIVLSSSVNEHAYRVLVASKGVYKNAPTIGASITDYLNSNTDGRELKQVIRTRLFEAGLKLDKIDVKNGNIAIIASRL